MQRTKTSLSKEFKESLFKHIKDNYGKEGVSCASIAREHDLCENTIKKYFNLLGLKRKSPSELSRKYKFDFRFLNDGSKKAEFVFYFLGWMASDGHLGRNCNLIKFSLNRGDKEVLQYIKNELNYTGEVKDVEEFNKGAIRQVSLLSFYNETLKKDLLKLGFDSDKTFTFKFPDWCKNQYFEYFLRGYFEGDGSVFFQKTSGDYGASIVGTRDFIHGLNQYLEREYGFKGWIENKNNCSVVCFRSNFTFLKLYNLIYKDHFEMSLKRKFLPFFKDIEILKSKKGLAPKTKKELDKSINIYNNYASTKKENTLC